ncbi:MAG TPA: acireductone synthase [Blastocatellia bacterium]|nr:acireductone synthase [Blastocatellia bacterium]
MNSTIRNILLDIEGTTTPINFVYQVLFPFARRSLLAYLIQHWSTGEVHTDLALLREEHAADTQQGLNPPALQTDVESVTEYLYWLMDRDRKSTPLKSLQGKIWRQGYESGELLSQVFDDVPLALQRWHQEGKQIYIYSSGSVLAQKLLFGHTVAGDLTPLLSGYFDTTIGAKTETDSYRRIATNIQQPPETVLFVSDVVAELDAASTAGMHCVLSVRAGNHPQPANAFQSINRFDEL